MTQTKAERAAAYQAIVEQRDHVAMHIEDLELRRVDYEAAIPGWDFEAELASLRGTLAEADEMIAAWRSKLD